MTNRSTRRRKRGRGSIHSLPSGALRVAVYAGIDPVTKRRHYLREVVPAGPAAEVEAAKAMRRLANQVDERRNPRTSATLNQLLDQHFAMLDLEPNTITGYQELATNHIRPLIGTQKLGALAGDVFDSFYAELRRCRARCNGRPHLDHRTQEPHDCDDQCVVHRCAGLSTGTIRKIHFILSGALKRAVRWRWLAVNPIGEAEPPPQPKPNPQPPTPAQAARLLDEAWRDPEWGLLIWLTMVTGFRRGELCGLRWQHLDLVAGAMQVERAIGQRSGRTWEKDTKSHQQRRLVLDPETITLLTAHRERCVVRAQALGFELSDKAFVFSTEIDGSAYLKPDSVTQRYGRLAARLGIKTTIHKLRHYSATELIAAGVDVRTVAGRLGHGGGGSTTLKVYAAWLSESDQRAATSLFSRLPSRSAPRPVVVAASAGEPRSPYEKIAAQLREQIAAGAIPVGEPIPTVAELAAAHGVAISTAQRAISLLKTAGLIDAARGHRARVVSAGVAAADAAEPATEETTAGPDDRAPVAIDPPASGSLRLWAIVVRGPDGHRYPPRHVKVDLVQPEQFRRHLVAVARMEATVGAGECWVGDFELEVHDPDDPARGPVRVLRWDSD